MNEDYYIISFDIIDATYNTLKTKGWFTHWEDKDKNCIVFNWDEALKFTKLNLAIEQFNLYYSKINECLKKENLIIKNIKVLSVADKPIFKEVYSWN